MRALNEGSTKFTYLSRPGWVNGETTINVWADLSKSGNTVFLDTFSVSAISTNLDFEINQRQSVFTLSSPQVKTSGSVSVSVGFLARSVVANPSFEASDKSSASPFYFENDVRIAGWTVDPPNQWGVNTAGDPFDDNGQNPDQDNALFVQGSNKSIQQTISGLIPGERYQLSFAYNARESTVPPHLQVTMDALQLMSADVAAVGAKKPYSLQASRKCNSVSQGAV